MKPKHKLLALAALVATCLPAISHADLGYNKTQLTSFWGEVTVTSESVDDTGRVLESVTARRGSVDVQALISDDNCYNIIYTHNVNGQSFTQEDVSAFLERNARMWDATSPFGTLPTHLRSSDKRALVEGHYLAGVPYAYKITISKPLPNAKPVLVKAAEKIPQGERLEVEEIDSTDLAPVDPEANSLKSDAAPVEASTAAK
jgi:hypothetical protein